MSVTLNNNNIINNTTTPIMDTTHDAHYKTAPQQTCMVAFHLPLPEQIENGINVEYMALTQRENAMAYDDAEIRDAERARRRPMFCNGAVRRILFPVK